MRAARGFSDADPIGVLVATDGAYTFAIEATLPASTSPVGLAIM